MSIDRDKKWFWNCVRGVCIICVILIHVTVPTNYEGIVRLEWYVLRKIIAFPVAMFFYMAGFFVHLEKTSDKKYLLSKIKRVLIPYLAFTTVYIFINRLMGTYANWKGIAANYLLGSSEIQMYYCIYLIQMILLLPVLEKLVYSKWRIIGLVLILLISVLCSYVKVYLLLFDTILEPLCLSFLIYYYLGLYVNAIVHGAFKSKLFEHLKKRSMSNVVAFTGASLLISLIEGYYPEIRIGQLTIGNYLFCCSIIALFTAVSIKCKDESCPIALKPIKWLGEQSFTMYLTHMIAMRPMIAFFEKISMSYPWRQMILFGATLLFCVAICFVKEKCFGLVNIKKRIGNI